MPQPVFAWLASETAALMCNQALYFAKAASLPCYTTSVSWTEKQDVKTIQIIETAARHAIPCLALFLERRANGAIRFECIRVHGKAKPKPEAKYAQRLFHIDHELTPYPVSKRVTKDWTQHKLANDVADGRQTTGQLAPQYKYEISDKAKLVIR